MRSRARLVLLSLILVPIAAAEALPSSPDLPSTGGIPTTATPSPTVAAPPSTTGILPGDTLDINQGGFVYQGTVADPTLIRIEDPQGNTVLDYHLDGAGHATLAIAGTNTIADATLLAIEGSPTGDAFTLHLLDVSGQPQDVTIDRVGLMSAAPPTPPISIARPPDWPGAPTAPYLLSIDDSDPNHLDPANLTGDAFLQAGGSHKATLQIPSGDPTFDRIYATVTVWGKNGQIEAPFEEAYGTSDAAVFTASFTPGLLQPVDGDTISVQPIYEHRVDPMVVERFAEATNYTYKVDGTAPTVSFAPPTTVSDFRFPLSWSGTDALTGIGGYRVDYKLPTQSLWTRWIDGALQTSATFSGDWGKTYQLRVTALDKVGNIATSPVGTVTVGAKPEGATEDDLNHAPTARLLTPAAGSVVGGITKITWDASDPDGAPVTSKLEVSTDNGVTWRILYSGSLTHADWNTRSYPDGPGYRLRLTVSDGTLQAADAASALSVRNVIAPAPSSAPSSPTPTAPTAPTAIPSAPASAQPGAAPATQTATPAPSPASAAGKKVPGPGAAIVLAAGLLGALLLARRRG